MFNVLNKLLKITNIQQYKSGCFSDVNINWRARNCLGIFATNYYNFDRVLDIFCIDLFIWFLCKTTRGIQSYNDLAGKHFNIFFDINILTEGA